MTQPRLLVVSHVLPFPGEAGQQQRVAHKLASLRKFFHVTFMSTSRGDQAATRTKLLGFADDVLLLPSLSSASRWSRLRHRGAAAAYSLRTGLKTSNYYVGQLEFSPARLRAVRGAGPWDCVLYEYWHAHRSTSVFREQGTPCVLDMHNVLWQSLAQRTSEQGRSPAWWRRRRLRKYRRLEEASWNDFDGVIAINSVEHRYVQSKLPPSTKLFHVPMGIDVDRWAEPWNPAQPVRVAYYGGLGTAHNQRAALRCRYEIMPLIWRQVPAAELWFVGSNPPPALRALAEDPRVKVTGFVQEVQTVLCRMSAVLCPWTGTYGFRSRLVEVMALGVPVVATPEAVDGMDLEDGKGLLLSRTDAEAAQQVLALLQDARFASEQSRFARQQVRTRYSAANTYGRFAQELFEWCSTRRHAPPTRPSHPDRNAGFREHRE